MGRRGAAQPNVLVRREGPSTSGSARRNPSAEAGCLLFVRRLLSEGCVRCVGHFCAQLERLGGKGVNWGLKIQLVTGRLCVL